MTIKGLIVTENQIIDGFIQFNQGYISYIGTDQPEDNFTDYFDSYIAPGFIDLHIHGLHYYLADNGTEEIKQICDILPQYGVTGFLPTLTPRRKGEDITFLKEISKIENGGAQILGFHLEGPFLKITGSLTTDAISAADTDRVQSLIEAAKPHRLIFSISPDVEGVEQLIPIMAENNTPVFITHTAADVKQTQTAIAKGARHATHLYDVFPTPEVTEPGVRPCGAIEAILADKRVSVDFILDGVHVDPVAVQMALACKSDGEGCVCLITDSNVGAGLKPGYFNFGNNGEIYFESKGSPARLVKDGTLAGSGLTMDRALQNAMKWLDVKLPQAIQLVSTNPARVLGIDSSKGKLEEGYDADFVILDKQYNVVQTWINGKRF